MNSKAKSDRTQVLCLIGALSLSLTANAALAQSQAQRSSGSAARVSAASQAQTSNSTSARTESASQAQSPASRPAVSTAGKTATSSAAPASTQPTVVAKGSDLVALQGPTVINQKSNGWKTTSGFIDLKDGQQTLPLTLTVTNGAPGQYKMQGIRMKLNGHEILTEKSFKGTDVVSLNMANTLTSGQTQLIVETYGSPQSAMSWVLTTYKIKVSDIKPVNCKIGDTVKITGKNFPTDKTAYKLTVESKSAKITAATPTGIDFTVPEVQGGKRAVTLYIAGVKCDPLYIKVAAAPEVTGANLLGVAPGGQVVISGKGFSTTAGENQVIFKNPDGSVMGQSIPSAATETELTVTLPMDIPCPSDVLCTVKTNGQESAKGITFSCSQRVIDKSILQ